MDLATGLSYLIGETIKKVGVQTISTSDWYTTVNPWKKVTGGGEGAERQHQHFGAVDHIWVTLENGDRLQIIPAQNEVLYHPAKQPTADKCMVSTVKYIQEELQKDWKAEVEEGNPAEGKPQVRSRLIDYLKEFYIENEALDHNEQQVDKGCAGGQAKDLEGFLVDWSKDANLDDSKVGARKLTFEEKLKNRLTDIVQTISDLYDDIQVELKKQEIQTLSKIQTDTDVNEVVGAIRNGHIKR